MAAVCAFDFCIRPRSALTMTPNATEATMIAIVDRMRFVDEFISVEAPLMRVSLCDWAAACRRMAWRRFR